MVTVIVKNSEDRIQKSEEKENRNYYSLKA